MCLNECYRLWLHPHTRFSWPNWPAELLYFTHVRSCMERSVLTSHLSAGMEIMNAFSERGSTGCRLLFPLCMRKPARYIVLRKDWNAFVFTQLARKLIRKREAAFTIRTVSALIRLGVNQTHCHSQELMVSGSGDWCDIWLVDEQRNGGKRSDIPNGAVDKTPGRTVEQAHLFNPVNNNWTLSGMSRLEITTCSLKVGCSGVLGQFPSVIGLSGLARYCKSD